jgi:hypothetical protein
MNNWMNLTAFWYFELVSNRTDLLKHFVRTIVTEKKQFGSDVCQSDASYRAERVKLLPQNLLHDVSFF